MQINPLTSADYPSILELWEASVRATHHFLTEEDINLYKEVIKNQALPNIDLYGIKSNTRLQGFLGISGSHIEMLFVHPDFFGQRIGTTLMDYALNHLHATKIDVNEQNPRAHQFYKKLGFKLTSRTATDPQGRPYPILKLSL